MNRNEPMFATNFWPDVAINLCLSQIWFSKINYYNYLKASSMLVAKKLPLGWGSTLNLVLKHGFLEGPLHLDDFPIKASIYRCFPIFPMVSYGFPIVCRAFPRPHWMTGTTTVVRCASPPCVRVPRLLDWHYHVCWTGADGQTPREMC
jgi:hypothetical protein